MPAILIRAPILLNLNSRGVTFSDQAQANDDDPFSTRARRSNRTLRRENKKNKKNKKTEDRVVSYVFVCPKQLKSNSER